MKRLLTIIALLSLFSLAAYASCPGTDSDVTLTSTEISPSAVSTPAVTVCTSDGACGLTVADPGSLDQGAATSISAFTGNTPCSETTQVFPHFTLPWENVQGSANDVIVDATVAGTSNDRIFTVGTISNGATGNDIFIQAYSKSTGAPMWRRVVALAGAQTGVALSWESTGSRLIVVGNDAASGNIFFYSIDQSGTEVCNKRIGDAGAPVHTANDVYAGGGAIANVVGSVDGTTALAVALDSSTCSLSGQKTVTSAFAGAEAFNKIDKDPSGNIDVVGIVQGAASSRAIEIEFTLFLSENHVNVFQFGTSGDDDIFYNLETDEDTGKIYFVGRLGSAAICAVSDTGAAIWPSSTYCKAYGAGQIGQFNGIALDDPVSSAYVAGKIKNGPTFDTVMAKFATSTGAMTWAKENSGVSESNTDRLNDITFVSTIVPNKVVAVGLLDSTFWGAIGRDSAAGALEFVQEYSDGDGEAKVVVTDNFNAFGFGYGTSVGMDYIPVATSATPEFSPITLLAAVLVAGAFVMFVVRRKR
jgi:hypothetical protein